VTVPAPAPVSSASEPAPRTAREMLERGRQFLERKGLEGARREAELLVAHALGLDRLRLFLSLDRPLAPEEIVRGRELLVRRAGREPATYLIGQREFYGRPFAVDREVLIPRPDTEILVDRARALLAGREAPRIADLGTGSGCIAITLALELPGAHVVASDRSAAALERARGNGVSLGATVEWRAGDGPAAVAGDGPFDLVTMNPPYVDPAVRDTLAPEVRDHEPALALFAPAGDPDHWVRRLLSEVPPLLASGGFLLVELGHDQAGRLPGLLEPGGLPWRVEPDLEGHARVLEVGPTP
jgi:release factor glutamine methyltransferase